MWRGRKYPGGTSGWGMETPSIHRNGQRVLAICRLTMAMEFSTAWRCSLIIIINIECVFQKNNQSNVCSHFISRNYIGVEQSEAMVGRRDGWLPTNNSFSQLTRAAAKIIKNAMAACARKTRPAACTCPRQQ